VENSTSKGLSEALLVSVLAVNSYPLEKAWALLPSLRDAHLTDPVFVASSDIAALTVLLAESGYNKGILTGLFAERVQQLMRAIHEGPN
jgi:hypothetical protein